MLPTLNIFNRKLHNINPFAGNNSGICIALISARVLKVVAKKIKIRMIIPNKATS